MKISNNDLKRYEKQIILKKIGVFGQKKIINSKVAIVGLGGLGSPLILYLANSGVGNLRIVDHDKVDISNLNRQVLFNQTDVGKFKISCAKKQIKKINKNIKISSFKEKINKKNINKILNKFNIICDCTDNFETRYLINDYCLKNKKTLISAAISKFDGQILNFNFQKNVPCYRCFVPEIPEQENNCESDGVIPTLAGIAGTIQANEVIKSILSNKNNIQGSIIAFNVFNLSFRKIKLNKRRDCINACRTR